MINTNRSFDLDDFDIDTSFRVCLTDPYIYCEKRITHLAEWLNSHCEHKFLIMVQQVLFQSEKDALIFRLGYKYPKD